MTEPGTHEANHRDQVHQDRTNDILAKWTLRALRETDPEDQALLLRMGKAIAERAAREADE